MGYQWDSQITFTNQGAVAQMCTYTKVWNNTDQKLTRRCSEYVTWRTL